MLPPVAVSVAVWPWHIEVLPTIVGVGSEAVVTKTEVEEEQPLGSVAVTV